MSSLYRGDRAGTEKLSGHRARKRFMRPVAWGQQDSLQDPCSVVLMVPILIPREQNAGVKSSWLHRAVKGTSPMGDPSQLQPGEAHPSDKVFFL